MEDIITSLFGYIYMKIKYRKSEKINQILNSDFGGSYSLVFLNKISSIMIIIFISILIIFLFSALYGIIFK